MLRELARAAAAAGIYLVLRPVWEWSGSKEIYRSVVIGLAERIVLGTQHFPAVSDLSNLTTRNIDFVVLLAIALMLVSTRIVWQRRLLLFGAALTVIVGVQILAFVAWVKMQTAQELESARHILVLLPAEFHAIDQIKLILYDFGQPATMFALFFLTLAWNTDLDIIPTPVSGAEGTRTRRPGRRFGKVLFLGLGVGVAIGSMAGSTIWFRWREHDSRHVEAHAKIGHLFWNSHKDAQAEEQYRFALAGGTTDPEVFYNLAGLEAKSGHSGAALQLLDQGMRMAHEPVWQSRFHKAISLIQSNSTSS